MHCTFSPVTLSAVLAWSRCPLFCLVVALAGAPSRADAHPVPKQNHDRVIVVHITAEALIVDYRLEVDRDGWTIARDLKEVLPDQEAWAALTTEAKVYDAFARNYAPLIAGNLTIKLDGRDLQLDRGPMPQPVLTDSVQFPFVFRASWRLQPGQRHQLTFHEGNYETDEGQIRITIVAAGAPLPLLGASTIGLLASPAQGDLLAAAALLPGRTRSVQLLDKTEADEATRNRPYSQRMPGDEKRLRRLSAMFELAEEAAPVTAPETAAATDPPKAVSAQRKLLGLLLNSDLGFWTLLTLAAGLGAAHALTPGHGKTLVAAYLVGERGTIWHAVLLGVTTTLTHTGSVLALALLLTFFYPKTAPADVQTAVAFVSGLLIAGLGFWLLLRRLSGGADHVHLGGHGHHHHHHGIAGDHFHDEHGHARPLAADQGAAGWRRLILLGISGGIVPCWDAIVMLCFAMAAQRLSLAVPLLLAFSAGLAGVLVAVGIVVVSAKGLAGGRWGESRVFRLLPVVSALVVFALGLWLCYDSLHPDGDDAPPSVAGRP
jgi:nickel/cobalt transporter (NicO) family protein